MNHLAHAFFSFHDENLLVGNLITDMLTLKESRDLTEVYHQGVILHRLIDKITDEHPVHKAGLKKMYPTQGKYAPVVLDIYYDYFLSKNWTTFTDADLGDVASSTYRTLQAHVPLLPTRIGPALTRMVEHDFLNSCFDLYRLELTFQRLQRRVTFESSLHLAVRDLEELETELESLFLDFFPDAIKNISRHSGV